jgi:hypothetical protein
LHLRQALSISQGPYPVPPKLPQELCISYYKMYYTA